jgi:cellobiose-specific phosphotransferase system component IIC
MDGGLLDNIVFGTNREETFFDHFEISGVKMMLIFFRGSGGLFGVLSFCFFYNKSVQDLKTLGKCIMCVVATQKCKRKH